MYWKEQLKKLEHAESFDITIFFMKQVLEKYPDERDTYFDMIYLVADTIIEPHS